MNKKRKPGHALMLIGTIVSVLAAAVTLLPSPSASKASALGYHAHCSFTPFSTIICLLVAGIFCIVRSKFFAKKS